MNQHSLSTSPRALAPRFASTREERIRVAAQRRQARRPPRASAEKVKEAESVLNLKAFLLLCAASFAFWSFVTRVSDGAMATYALVGGLSLAVFALMLRQRATSGLTILAYLAAVQPALRQATPELPYLALNYLLIASALFLFVTDRRPMKFAVPVLCYGFYVLLEATGLIGGDSFVYGRTVFVPSLTILVYLALAFKFRFSRQDLQSIFCAYIAGSFGIVAILLSGFQKSQGIQWGTESNSQASGGMGGNQITFLLAVAAFMCFLSADELRGLGKIVLWGMAGVLAYFMVLTFSRGGLYMLVAVSTLYYVFLKKPSANTLITLAVFAIAGFIVYDATVQTTGGEILARYSETTVSNRDRIAAGGWKIFLDNMSFGIGTGNFYTKIDGIDGLSTTGAHNELIRAAAEHGIFGLISWVLFTVSGLAYAAFGAGAQDRDKRALRVAFFMFLMFSVAYNGLKLLAQPFLLLIALGAFTAEYEAWHAARHARRQRNQQLTSARVLRKRQARRNARLGQNEAVSAPAFPTAASQL